MTKEDKQNVMQSIFQVTQIQKTGHHCNCMCHKEGIEVMHMFPCCDKTYQKFDKK